MKKFFLITILTLVLTIGTPLTAMAQTDQPPATPQTLTVYTSYPSQVVGIGEVASLDIKLQTGEAQTVKLEMKDLPEGWNATFKGTGKVIQSVYVLPDTEASVDLRLEQPADITAGSYHFTVLARGEKGSSELAVELTIKDKIPPRLSFSIELPTLKGTPSSTFRYNATLKNEGDEDIDVNLMADAPAGFMVNIKLNSQVVTNIPISAGESKSLSIEVKPISDIPAGSYPINLLAQGSTTQAKLALTAEVTGQAQISITAPDGRLSAQAYIGKVTPISIVVQNNGSAPADGIQLSASAPTGWNVEFEPSEIAELPAGQQVEVSAKIQPSDQAVAGDYVVTMKATNSENMSQSADFRITVLTSTLWGVAGIILIAVAIGVVALAVVRFGRR